MDIENRLHLRAHRHLRENESILATLFSAGHGLYVATNRRVLCLNERGVGYNLRIHPYDHLTRARYFSADHSWFVELFSKGRAIKVRARSQREAEGFARSVARMILSLHDLESGQAAAPGPLPG
jgi:hypothetical protein